MELEGRNFSPSLTLGDFNAHSKTQGRKREREKTRLGSVAGIPIEAMIIDR